MYVRYVADLISSISSSNMALQKEAEELYKSIELAAAAAGDREVGSQVLPTDITMFKQLFRNIKRFLRLLEEEDEPDERAEDLSGELDEEYSNIKKLHKLVTSEPAWTSTMSNLAEEMLESFSF